MNDSEIRAMWLYAAEKWPNYPLPPTSEQRDVRLVAWRDEFADVPADAVRRALSAPALAVERWFPPLGLVRQQALLDLAAIAGQGAPPDTDVAWLEVCRQIRATGHAGLPEWSHPAIGEAVAAVGWRVLCMSDEGDPARFRQFRDFYALASARHVAALAPAPTAALDGAGYPRGLPTPLAEHREPGPLEPTMDLSGGEG